MSDAEQTSAAVEDTATEQESVDYQAKYEETKQKLESLAAHQEKLLDEAKKAKQSKREIEMKELEARRQQEEHAAKNGEYEKLFKQRDQEYKKAIDEINNLKQTYRKEKIDVMSMNIANDLADGANAKLLSKFISESLGKLSDDNGSLSEDVLESVKTEFKNDATYGALLRSSKASGGGAPGQQRGAQKETGTMTRTEFHKLNPTQQHKFIVKDGGQVIED